MKNRVVWMGLITIIGFPLLGWICHLIFLNGWHSFVQIFSSETNFLLELSIGLVYGTVCGLLGWALVYSKWMRPMLTKYGDLVKNMRLNLLSILLLSICAGVGEEVFFRGVLQPYFGVWITAVFFVAIHGYLSVTDIKIFTYGSLMTLFIVGIGYMTEKLGIASAMMAHCMIDVILFYKLTHFTLEENEI